MLMIVLHHYCVNSGLIELIEPKSLTGNMLFIQFMSIGGKVGVNIFFIISGYFMINSKFKWRKVGRLFFQILSVNLLVFLFLMALGYRYGFRQYLTIVPLIFSVPTSFIASYVVIYILTPVINKALNAFEKKDFQYLLLVLLVFFSVMPTLLKQETWHYVGWGFTMYVLGAYIHKFDLKAKELPFGWLSLGMIFLTWCEILLFDYMSAKHGLRYDFWTFAIADANKLNIFFLSLSIFMFFAKLQLPYIKPINAIGGSVAFGVLLWHANNSVLRQWLWFDFLKNTEYLNHDYLWLHCLVSVILIYGVCTLLEIVRQKVLDKPLFEGKQRRMKNFTPKAT